MTATLRYTLLLASASLSMFAQGQATFSANGLQYAISSADTAQVTGFAGADSSIVSIPDSVENSGTTYRVTSVGNDAFEGFNVTPQLTRVEIGNNVTEIGVSAFEDNPQLAVVEFGSALETIGFAAFAQASALTSIRFPASLLTIGRDAFLESGLTSVEIGNSVTTIGDRAFFFGSRLESAVIGPSVETIGVAAFGENELTTLTIPAAVTAIGFEAFGSNRLNSVAFEGDFGVFDLQMFKVNTGLNRITYCQDNAGWPQDFNVGQAIERLVAAVPDPQACQGGAVPIVPIVPIVPDAVEPVPASPFWLLLVMAGLLSIAGAGRLQRR